MPGRVKRGEDVISPVSEYPFLRPNPPRLSRHPEALASIEKSGWFSNYGPVNQELEEAFVGSLFGGSGHCVTMCNATIGLILSIRFAVDRRFGRRPPNGGRTYALMPAFTFAATAHAALWNNLVPLFCDIEPGTWLPSLASQESLLEQFKDEVAVIVTYATFGNNLDLPACAALASRHGVPLVVDAAASLGSRDARGRQFGADCASPVVYSMHATKLFSTGEAGLVYCSDRETVETLRCMGNFGFGQGRSATMPGLNSKLTEIGALLCREKLKELDAVVENRLRLTDLYREALPEFTFQALNGSRHAHQFLPVLLPEARPGGRDAVIAWLAASGVSARTYFSPHLAEQPFFQENARAPDLPVTRQVAERILSLPLYEGMTPDDVGLICERLRQAVRNA